MCAHEYPCGAFPSKVLEVLLDTERSQNQEDRLVCILSEYAISPNAPTVETMELLKHHLNLAYDLVPELDISVSVDCGKARRPSGKRTRESCDDGEELFCKRRCSIFK